MKKPNYTPELFVDREEECALVAGVAKQALDGAVERPRVLVFYGERGSGKTWLALHLQRKVLEEMAGVEALLLRFSLLDEDDETSTQDEFAKRTWSEPKNEKVDDKAQRLMIWIAEQVGAATGRNFSLETLADWLVRDISRKYTGRLLVIILDSLLEADRALHDKLESALLAPLVTLPNILIIMTGRGELPNWTSPYLRPTSNTLRRLKPFAEADVRKQISRQIPQFEGDIEDIIVLGGGHPYSTYLLAHEPDRGKALESAIDVLLSVIPSSSDRDEVRSAFESLCVLQGFREFEIQKMMATDYGHEETELTIIQARRLRDLMLSTHLLRWDKRWFTIDEAVVHILRNYLRIEKPELNVELQRRAFRMYSQLASSFAEGSEARKFYLDLARPHREAIRAEGYDPEGVLPSQAAYTKEAPTVHELATA